MMFNAIRRNMAKIFRRVIFSGTMIIVTHHHIERPV